MFIISKHAERRCRQRGIKKEHILLFLKYAENENNIGSGDICYTSGKISYKEMINDGISNDLISKFKKFAVIICSDNIIKTCLYMKKNNGKKYRKSFNRRFNNINTANDNHLLPEVDFNGWNHWV